MNGLRESIRKQMAVDETALRDHLYSARLGFRDPVGVEALKQVEADRGRLETMTEAELQDLGLLYVDRPGYLEEWRP